MRVASRQFTVFLASIAALTSLSIDMSLPAVPAIESEFHLTPGQGGLTLSLFLAGYAFTPLLGGPLADRFGRRPVLFASLAIFAVSAVACSVAPDFTFLLIFRLFQGSAAGVSTTLPLAIVRDLLEGHGARQRVSEMTTINSIMPIVAPIFGLWMMTFGSWRTLFGIQAMFAFCMILAALTGFTESLPAERRQRIHPKALARNYVALFSNRTFLVYAVIYGFTFACMFSFISVSPLILMQRMHVGRSAFTFLFALIALGTILGSLSSALLSHRRTPVHWIIRGGLTLMTLASMAAAALQLGGHHRPGAILPFVFLTFYGFGLSGPSVTMEALTPVPHLAGSASGALRSILMISGSGTSGLLAAYCARHFSIAEIATTLTMSGMALVALMLYLWHLRRERAFSVLGNL